jgi:hypothetical protein
LFDVLITAKADLDGLRMLGSLVLEKKNIYLMPGAWQIKKIL